METNESSFTLEPQKRGGDKCWKSLKLFRQKVKIIYMYFLESLNILVCLFFRVIWSHRDEFLLDFKLCLLSFYVIICCNRSFTIMHKLKGKFNQIYKGQEKGKQCVLSAGNKRISQTALLCALFQPMKKIILLQYVW